MNKEALEDKLAALIIEAHHTASSVQRLTEQLTHMEERTIPASTAGIAHTVGGVNALLADLAGTVHALASQTHSMNDRITLLERVIDFDTTGGT